MPKTYNCKKCGSASREAYEDTYFKQRWGMVCLWCADIVIDESNYLAMDRAADAANGDL
jgi:hypothetical protein